GGDTLAEAARLADVEHLAAAVEHAVDAGLVIEQAQIVADHPVSGPPSPAAPLLLETTRFKIIAHNQTATSRFGPKRLPRSRRGPPPRDDSLQDYRAQADRHELIRPEAAASFCAPFQAGSFPRSLWITLGRTSGQAAFPIGFLG